MRFPRVVSALAIPLSLVASVARGQTLPDSIFQRAQRLIRTGEASRGNALLDSVVSATREGTDPHAQALLWRATLATDSSAVERDLLTIIVNHALSPHAADALLRLGQVEYARGARPAAVRHLERLVLDHRASRAATDGWFWLGLARIANNDVLDGCVALDSARRRIPDTNVELLNRVNFVAQPCRAIADAREAAPPAPDSAPPAEKPATKQWSAQVGAFNTNAEAARLMRTLIDKGYKARIDTLQPRFHVRVGAFETRAEAVSLATRLKREKIDAIVVEATRREP